MLEAWEEQNRQQDTDWRSSGYGEKARTRLPVQGLAGRAKEYTLSSRNSGESLENFKQ